ncbi:MAG: type II toxin-antitoxin system CcdA family antitoxin [Deltaproteobacteria bacterium]|nr:type II toxin-antitoxin system CcdA family antitoxin [Deltaproteobacteria bacterium]MBT4526468.1 type II toxin-antitoxin system CcdA family antitoxin [Deltaproteobacteria bacterium]
MENIYNKRAPKKATNLSINSDLLKKARNLNINLSSTFENALVEIVRKKQEEKWKQANAEAINTYNEFVEENGVFSQNIRSF